MTAAAAVDGIRKVDSTGGIGMISAEPDAPYNRPPLSKALWKGKPLESTRIIDAFARSPKPAADLP